MKGFLAFFGGCAIVAGLSLVPPDEARWFAIGFLVAVAYVASALPRRAVQPSHRRRVSRVRGAGSSH